MPSRFPSIVLLALAGCSGEPDASTPWPDLHPRLLEGGGVTDPGIAGALYVHVVDSATHRPVAGASVRVQAAGLPTTGMTDLGGLFRLERAGIRGPQTITVQAPEYVLTSWVGVDGGNVTIPLDPSSPETVIPTAQARGAITGWDELAAPAEGHYLIAAVDYTRPRDLSSAENLVQQVMRGMVASNVCLRESAAIAACSWMLQTRLGRQLHFGFVLDGDRRGTDDPRDDVFEVVALARAAAVDLGPAERLEGERLSLTDRELLDTLEVTLSPLPAGTAQVVGVPGVSTPDAGLMLVPTPIDMGRPRVRLPKLEGDLAGGSYWVIATAASAEPGSASSTIIRRQITDTHAPVALGQWMLPPPPPSLAGRVLSFAAVRGASTYGLDLRSSGGLVVWRIAVLDSRTRVELPVLDPDPLAANPDAIVLSASEVAYDRRDFRLGRVRETLTRAVSRTGRITR